jgi:hypothetical protein
MKALSIRQPWAWLVANGHKTIENRTWTSHYRGAFFVHASAGGTKAERADIRRWVHRRFGVLVPDDEQLRFGGIVGRASVADVVSSSRSPWFKGPFGFVLDEARPLRFRPMRGALGFFTLDESRNVSR